MLSLQPTEWIAIYAAIIATGALFLEVRRWFETGAKIRTDIMPFANVIGGYEKDENDYLFVGVTNNGDRPTTITHFVLHEYDSVFHRLVRKARYSGIVPKPELSGTPALPFLLEPGIRWGGQAIYNEELLARAKSGKLFVGVYCSHSTKPFLKWVDSKKVNKSKMAEN